MRPLRLLPAACIALAACSVVLAPAPAFANSFHVECASSHFASDDPIVVPGRPGASHRHEFFGARGVDAHSTTRSMRRAATTCAAPRDTASYWAPSLEVAGRLRRGTMTAYYQRAGKRRAGAPPLGLRMIAGDARAATPQAMRVTSWQCRGSGAVRSSRQSPTVPRCRTGQQLATWVRFPDCWDGRRLDSPDHRSHMAYARGGECPPSHPVALMKVVVRITWPTRPARARSVTLAGGALGSTGMHADFWNAWHMPTLRQLRWDCIEVATPCGAISR